MRNKRGFTLLELLAILVIIGILLALAVPSVHKYLKMGIGSYYTNLEKSVTLAGKDYFADFRTLLPKEIGNVRVIDFEELVKNKYIDPIKDSDGNLCEGKVVVKKVDKNNYEYYTCIKCGENGETYTSDICEEVDNSSEDNNITPDTDDYELVLEIDGSGLNVCQADSFTIPKVKVLHKNNNGEWEETTEVATVSPKKIDTNSLGTKKLIYSYKGKILEKEVVVMDCSNPSKPQVVLRYDNNKGNVYNGKWYSGNIFQEFLSTDYINGFTGSGIDYYEISTDGGKSYTKIDGNSKLDEKNGNYTYYVRAVDKTGRSGEAISYNLKIDKEAPSCALKIEGTKGSNGWYTSEVKISFENCYDNPIGMDNSGIANKVFTTNSNKFGSSQDSIIITDTNERITVTGTVTDNAGNTNNPDDSSYKVDIRVDTTTSEQLQQNLNITADDGILSGNWHKNDKVTLQVNGASANGNIIYYIDSNKSNVESNSSSAKRDKIEQTTNTLGTTYYAKACNEAGICSDIIEYILKLDNIKPVLVINPSDGKESGKWHNSDFNLNYSGANNISGNTYYYGTDSNPTTPGTSTTMNANTPGTTYYAKVCSGAGLCSDVSDYMVMLDKIVPNPPTITASDGQANGTWHNQTFTLNYSGANNISGNTYYYGTDSNPTTPGTSTTMNTNTPGTTYYAKVCSGAGLCSSNSTYQVKRDDMIPTFAVNIKGTEGSNGWYISDVIIEVTQLDGTGSGIGATSISPSKITTSTKEQVVNISVTDEAGNVSTDQIILKVDKGEGISLGFGTLTDEYEPGSDIDILGHLNVNYGISGGGSVACTVNDQTVKNISQLGEGTHKLICTVTTNSGRAITQEKNITIKSISTCMAKENNSLAGYHVTLNGGEEYRILEFADFTGCTTLKFKVKLIDWGNTNQYEIARHPAICDWRNPQGWCHSFAQAGLKYNGSTNIWDVSKLFLQKITIFYGESSCTPDDDDDCTRNVLNNYQIDDWIAENYTYQGLFAFGGSMNGCIPSNSNGCISGLKGVLLNTEKEVAIPLEDITTEITAFNTMNSLFNTSYATFELYDFKLE